MKNPKKRDELKIGDRVWAAGKPGTVTSYSGDGQRVPWIKCDDGQQWDARDLGSIQRIPTVEQAAEDLVAYMERPGATYSSIQWEVVTTWLKRAVAEKNRARLAQKR